MRLPFDEDRPVFPAHDRSLDDPFIRMLAASRKKCIVLTDDDAQPRRLLNANAFLQDFLVLGSDVALCDYCHRPAVVTRPTETLDKALGILATLRARDAGHYETVMLLWSPGVCQDWRGGVGRLHFGRLMST